MSKKAVITTGSKQYVVSVGDTIQVESLKNPGKSVTLDALLVIDGENIKIGTPIIDGVKVSAEVVNETLKGDKVVSIRYKAKKRVHTVRGHRQTLTELKITKIS